MNLGKETIMTGEGKEMVIDHGLKVSHSNQENTIWEVKLQIMVESRWTKVMNTKEIAEVIHLEDGGERVMNEATVEIKDLAIGVDTTHNINSFDAFIGELFLIQTGSNSKYYWLPLSILIHSAKVVRIYFKILQVCIK